MHEESCLIGRDNTPQSYTDFRPGDDLGISAKNPNSQPSPMYDCRLKNPNNQRLQALFAPTSQIIHARLKGLAVLAVRSGFFSGSARNNRENTGNFEKIVLAWRSAWDVLINDLWDTGADSALKNRELLQSEQGINCARMHQ